MEKSFSTRSLASEPPSAALISTIQDIDLSLIEGRKERESNPQGPFRSSLAFQASAIANWLTFPKPRLCGGSNKKPNGKWATEEGGRVELPTPGISQCTCVQDKRTFPCTKPSAMTARARRASRLLNATSFSRSPAYQA